MSPNIGQVQPLSSAVLVDQQGGSITGGVPVTATFTAPSHIHHVAIMFRTTGAVVNLEITVTGDDTGYVYFQRSYDANVFPGNEVYEFAFLLPLKDLDYTVSVESPGFIAGSYDLTVIATPESPTAIGKSGGPLLVQQDRTPQPVYYLTRPNVAVPRPTAYKSQFFPANGSYTFLPALGGGQLYVIYALAVGFAGGGYQDGRFSQGATIWQAVGVQGSNPTYSIPGGLRVGGSAISFVTGGGAAGVTADIAYGIVPLTDLFG